jgi:hypothetical protein
MTAAALFVEETCFSQAPCHPWQTLLGAVEWPLLWLWGCGWEAGTLPWGWCSIAGLVLADVFYRRTVFLGLRNSGFRVSQGAVCTGTAG